MNRTNWVDVAYFIPFSQFDVTCTFCSSITDHGPIMCREIFLESSWEFV